jgi:capsular polysaccharide export protein
MERDDTCRPRTVLLLQGPSSWFFTLLAAALRRRGAQVHRVLFCPGDRLFWGGPGAVAYRGGAGGWGTWLVALIRSAGITDIVCLGDGRARHAEAVRVAMAEGVAVHRVELGYLRPHWLTVERMARPGEPRPPDPSASQLPDPPQPRFRSSFAAFAAMDVTYNLANLIAAWLFYPGYRSHALDPPLREWVGWTLKALRLPWRSRARVRAQARIDAHVGPVFLFPLQLETDFQIRLHGADATLHETLVRVAASFARHAPRDALLVIKPHPLDNGLAPWGRRMRAVMPVQNAWVLIDGGSLEALLDRAAGVVTVNSTVGLTALRAGRPVIALGTALYDRPGLTDRGGLDRFWTQPQAPDAEAVRAFVRVLAAVSQVPGGFDGEGARPGAEAVAARILAHPAAAVAPAERAA